ncbi:MAG: DedA family protein [Gammaproteobacteria bacterium]|nr:MAG: DedA family protein [Gammaproteobacteria bacterium]
MKIFSALYSKTLQWAKHPRAEAILCVFSAAESIFFPIPTDVMLAPMVLSRREQAWRLAFLTVAFSVLGGIVGYWLGYGLMTSWVEPWLQAHDLADIFIEAHQLFAEHGVWIVLLAGFSPIPYKAFTLTAGAAEMPFWPFVLASIIGRAGRFYLVAALLYWGGENLKEKLHQWVDWAGWAVVGFVMLYLVFR